MKPLLTVLLVFFSVILHGQDNDAMIKDCLSGSLAGVKKNIEGGANVNYKNAAGQTALSVAYLWPEITEYLLSKGADANGGDYPALVGAARYYSIDVMKLLLKAGADPNKIAEVKVDVAGPMKKLLEDEKAKGKKANKYMVKAYEDQIKKLPADNKITFTALQTAVSATNCKECIELLLNAGAKTEFRNALLGGNIIHEATSGWKSDEQRAKDMKTNMPYLENAGLILPVWYKNLDVSGLGTIYEIIQLLKAKGADIEALDNNKRTPLTGAVLQPTPNDEVIAALLDNGANIKATGMTLEETDFSKETSDAGKIKVRFDFPREGRNGNGGGYSANMDLLKAKPKRVALISFYVYDAGNGKAQGSTFAGSATTTAWRTSDFVGQTQANGFYNKSINELKSTFKENGIDLLTPTEFLDSEEKIEFYYGFNQESAKKEKTEFKMRGKMGTMVELSSLKASPSDKGYRPFFVANEPVDESIIANFQGGIFSANRKLTSSLGYDLANGLGVDAVVVVYIGTRKPKQTKDEYGVNTVVTMMLGPNPGKSEDSNPDAKNLGQFYCGTRTYYSSPLIFKLDKGLAGQYDGMANILKAHAAKMCKYVNGKEKDED